jgi:hypothetical protein
MTPRTSILIGAGVGLGAIGLAAAFALRPAPSATEFVDAYLSQQNCADRVQFVYRPEVNRAPIVERYKDQTTCVTPHTDTRDEDCAPLTGDGRCTVSALFDGKFKRNYCMIKSDGAFLIDWRCSVAYSPMPLKTYKAMAPKGPQTFRVAAEFSDFFGYEYNTFRGTLFAVRFTEPDSLESIQGYVPKKSPDGERLGALLKDGRQHRVTVTLSRSGDHSDFVDIVGVVAEDWFHREDEG